MYCTSAMKSYTLFVQQGRINDHSSGSRLQLEHAVAGVPANTAFQLTASREIVGFLKVPPGALAAVQRQAVRPPSA
jgi:hypothetical protein